jgi:RsmE family RNA methyltransferase
MNKADRAFAVGPEGGFTPEEVKAARDAGWQVIALGPRILRVETAALVLAASAAVGVATTKDQKDIKDPKDC